MQKITFLVVTLISAMSFGQATDLFFSMYGEGSSSNKWIEIYNGTGADVDLSGYTVELYANDNVTPTSTEIFETAPIIPNGGVYVLYNTSADAAITSAGDASSAVTNFNGNDALLLYHNGVLIDQFGVVGANPGSGGWDVAGTSGATVDNTLIRKSSVCEGNPAPLASFGTDEESSEWLVGDNGTGWDAIGSHTADCEGMSTPKNNQAAFVMYPNPSSTGKVQIQTKEGSNVNVTVFDILGKKVISKTIENELNISGLKTGIYLVQVTNNGATVTKKLIVE